jgi:hypothetical protein
MVLGEDFVKNGLNGIHRFAHRLCCLRACGERNTFDGLQGIANSVGHLFNRLEALQHFEFASTMY